MFPFAQFLSPSANTASDDSDDSCQLVRVLWEATNLSSRMSLLPDLIELYVWLHDTFRFLATKEYAFTATMSDLMKKERLQERFDSVRVHHILVLWDRVISGLKRILDETGRKVHWECEEVSIPFDTVENAKLVFLLSEGSHPTDGNDFLFLVINETIALYNNFAEKLAVVSMPSDANADNTTMLQPRFIIRGNGGAAKVVIPLSKNDLNWMAECCWDSETRTYDSTKMKNLLHGMINLHDRPAVISNPLDHLREKFCFRDDAVLSFGESHASIAITTNKDGYFFANYQDAQLVDEVNQLLSTIGMTTGDEHMRRTLADNFHGLDYDRIRAVLEGCRSFIDLLMSYGNDSFQTIGTSLDDLVYGTEDRLQAIGFPMMTEQQSRLVLSLDAHQLVELIHYVGYQLASEAYLFSNLPLYMTDPLTGELEQEIAAALGNNPGQKNVEVAAKHVDEFVRDVLSFYESQLIDVAAKSSRSLRDFLSESNFCDATDPVFAVLPSTVTLRNYISLRQRLHQIKLALLFRSTDLDPVTTTDVNRNESFTKTTRGRCWLWEDENLANKAMYDETAEDGDAPIKSSRDQWKLWFEQALPGDESACVDYTAEASVTAADDVEMEATEREPDLLAADKEVPSGDGAVGIDDANSLAAKMLQRWWRRESELLAEMDRMDCDESDSENGDYYMADTSQRVESQGDDAYSEAETDGSIEHRPRKRTGASPMVDITYGTREDEVRMRKWLDNHSLPQTVADTLLELGARCLEDVSKLVREYPEALSEFAMLDRMKLKEAVAAGEALT